MTGTQLEHMQIERANAADSIEQKEEALLKEIKKQLDDTQLESIDRMTKDQLATFIQKEFQTNKGSWIIYDKMKTKGSIYAFTLEAAMDFLSDILGDKKYTENGTQDTTTDGSGWGKTLDERLKKYGSIDAKNDEKTTKIVQLLQKILGITVDGLAGPETMANIVALLKWNELKEIQVEGFDQKHPYGYNKISQLIKKQESVAKAPEQKQQKEETQASIESIKGIFTYDELTDPRTKILKMIPENFDPAIGQVDIFYCGFGVTIEDQKKVFEENPISANHAVIIVEGNPRHISRTNNPAARYNTIKANVEKFKKEIETKVFTGKTMRHICLIGHSGAGTVVNDLTGKLRQQGWIDIKTIIIDGTYGAHQTSNMTDNDKIYYVPNTTTQTYASKDGIALTGTDHFSIIPKALTDADIIQT